MDEPTESSQGQGGAFSPTAVLWMARSAWLAFGVVGTATFGEALDARSGPVQLVAAIGLWAAWGVALVAMLAPSTAGLTVSRLVVAGAVPAAIAAGVAGAGAVPFAASLALGSLATLAVFSAEYALIATQASAYGSERRFPLRPPAPFLAPMVIFWCLIVAALTTGPLLAAAGRWLPGVVITVAGAGLAVVVGPRFHRLSRRWLVLVPVGLVLHDQVLLAETVMLRRSQVTGVSLALEGTTAHDLTGITWGTPIELRLGEAQTIVPGTAVPVTTAALLISPSRPGRALSALRAAGLPVG